MHIFHKLATRVGILGNFFEYLWEQKQIILILTAFFLVLFGGLILFLQSQVAPTPFIYTLF